MLSVNELSFAYGENSPVVEQFSTHLAKGEVVSLLGPSGCGKSTVLRLVAGLLAPSAGRVNWEQKPELAFVFQEHALMPWATIAENVSLPGRLKGNEDRELVRAALNSVELADFHERFPMEISGGQRMRASVARALAANPNLLLMDEPFAALDEILRFQMNDLLLALRDEKGFSVLFVTHSLYEAAYLSDRVLVMRNGRVCGEVQPTLDRAINPEEQRSSSAFMNAVHEIGALLAGEAK